MSAESGGYAYPQSEAAGSVSHSIGGLTLPDYFAGQALMGLHANGDVAKQMDEVARIAKLTVSAAYAKVAYENADAMIKARG